MPLFYDQHVCLFLWHVHVQTFHIRTQQCFAPKRYILQLPGRATYAAAGRTHITHATTENTWGPIRETV